MPDMIKHSRIKVFNPIRTNVNHSFTKNNSLFTFFFTGDKNHILLLKCLPAVTPSPDEKTPQEKCKIAWNACLSDLITSYKYLHFHPSSFLSRNMSLRSLGGEFAFLCLPRSAHLFFYPMINRRKNYSSFF